jgi:RNA polymerase sigma-70 factor, ECF subfamily
MASRDSQAEDLKCVAAVKGGRAEAFGDVVKRYQDRLFNTIYRLLGDYQEAGDLTQQAFMKAYLSLDQFRGGSSFYTWLYRIGVNTALDERKKRSRNPQVLSESFAMSPDEDTRRLDGAAAADDPAEEVLSRERETAVARAIASLDEVHRTVLVLRDIEGLDYEEIAEVAACPRGTVKSRLHRARLMLREKLKGFMQ